jgi:hypothetical protein
MVSNGRPLVSRSSMAWARRRAWISLGSGLGPGVVETVMVVAPPRRRMGNHPFFEGVSLWTSRGLFQFHGRRNAADRHVGSFIVVCP